MTRLTFSVLTIATGVVILLFLATSDGGTQDPAFTLDQQTANTSFTVTAAPVRYQGKTAEWWARRAVQARRDANARARTIRRLRAELALEHEPSSVRAIALASTTYHVSFHSLYRIADCETGGTLSPFARNPASSASGLYQFLPSTWASTPYANFSIWDPYANALAAAWMHTVGRGNEWVCQ